jgi:hypothetical protein
MEPASFESSPDLTRRDLALLGAAVLVGSAAYLIASARTYHLGFPLDDSWIHQTYARNLALRGEWAFQPGRPSAGSTAPLWTFLLALGYWMRLAPYSWAFLLGGLTLLGLSALGERTARRLIPQYRPRLPWVGAALALEWHMLWAAMSGMETLLQAFLLTATLVLLMTGSRRFLAMGLLTGLSVWVRPDGLTLVGPVILTALIVEPGSGGARGQAIIRYLIGLGCLLVPYLLFNLSLSGTPMPNTFYAKQAEYAAWQARPILGRLAELALQFLTGPAVILLPGALTWGVHSFQRRAWGSLASMIWFGGYLALYLARLPFYQHGRYIMPAMPIFFLWGFLGLLRFRYSPVIDRRHWAIQSAWEFSLALVSLGFLILGARSYGGDVAIIETEMVATARWAAGNLPPDAVIAAHDIGALGYYDQHELIDLAGLISPEVVPIIRDEARLADFLTARHVAYLIAFPDFYPLLSREAVPVFVSGGAFSPAAGHENMTVYRWPSP